MKQEKKRSSLSRLLSYAGGHRALTVLGCVLSGIAAVLGLAPYFASGLWPATRWRSFPTFLPPPGHDLGVDGGLVCRCKYRVLFCRPDVHPHRSVPHSAQHSPAAMRHVVSLPLGFSAAVSPAACASSSTTTPASQRTFWPTSSRI